MTSEPSPPDEEGGTKEPATAAAEIPTTEAASAAGPVADGAAPETAAPADASASNEPASNEPASNEPASDAPASNEPASNEPASSEPASSEPASSEATENASADGEEQPASEPAASTTVPPSKPDGRTKIQVGSRRGKPGEPTSSKPKVVGADKPIEGAAAIQPPAPQRRSTPVPKPSVRDPLSPELQQELESAMVGAELDQMLIAGDGPAEVQVELDSRRRATVIRVEGEYVFFSLSGRHEGVVSVRQFGDKLPAPGTPMDVRVTAFNAEDGLYELTIPGASIDVADWSDLAEGSVVECRITGSNTGGLECKVNTIPGFIPMSQIALYRVENLNEFFDQKMTCVVTEVNPRRKRLVLSRRAVLEREREEQKKQLIDNLQVGAQCEGVVRSIRDFGAFVDLGGVDGLIHISELSWERVEHPSEVLKEGQKVQVKIEKVNRETGKIGLSYRSLTEHPWTGIESRFSSGEVVKGTVTRIAKFGAFVKLTVGVEGLIHISELSHQRIAKVSSAVEEGQDVDVKILSIDQENQRIALSLKATLEAPPEPDREEAAPIDRELAVERHKGPLKGGTDRPSGGEQFGLKW